MPCFELLYGSIPVSKDDLQPPVRPKEGMIGLAHPGGGRVAQLEPDHRRHGDGGEGEGGLDNSVQFSFRHVCKYACV